MTREAEAAMAAIEKALRKERFPRMQKLWRRLLAMVLPAPETPFVRESREHLDVLAAYLLGKSPDYAQALTAIDDLAGKLGYQAVPLTDDWGDDDPPLRLDENQLDAAAAYARRGQIADALHHLERALPDGFGDIAERIARHLERTAP